VFDKKTIRDIELEGKRVLVRVDFNVPISGAVIQDDTRIQAALPTIEYLLDHHAAVTLCSHLGRPKGVFNQELSLSPISEYLSKLFDRDVFFSEDCIGPQAETAAENLKPGQVLLLENTRFHIGEKQNNPKFAKQLASMADIFVNDAFGTAHRSHASNVGVAKYLPAVAGFLLEKEITYLGKAIENPAQPFVVILGGAKVSDKIGVIENLLDKASQILIGGGMANTFFKALGYPVGDSLFEMDVLGIARKLLKNSGNQLRLPVDVVIADRFADQANNKVIGMGPIPDGWRILDIGPETIEGYGKTILNAATVVWNGPMGVFEFPTFARGTFELARYVSESQAISIIGGGDSISASKLIDQDHQ
jgi:phosphoglycerate kinase